MNRVQSKTRYGVRKPVMYLAQDNDPKHFNVDSVPDELNIGVVAACPPPHRTASAGKALELDEY